MLKYSVELNLDQEQMEQIFEDLEIKFSKAKVNKLKKMMLETEPDLIELLEEALRGFLEDLITDEWER
jgi:hypothetical protein